MNKVAILGVDNSINGQTTQLDSLLRKYTKISWENGLGIQNHDISQPNSIIIIIIIIIIVIATNTFGNR